MQNNYENLLQAMGLGRSEIQQRLVTVRAESAQPLEPIAPVVEQLLGPSPLSVPLQQLDELLDPARSVEEALAELDRQYRVELRPQVYFLGLDEPIASHLDELLGSSLLDIPLNEPIAPHLDELLGPAEMTGTQSV